MLLGFKVGKFAITDVQQSTLQLQEQRLKKVQLLKSAWQKAIEAESLALGIDPNMVMSGFLNSKQTQAGVPDLNSNFKYWG